MGLKIDRKQDTRTVHACTHNVADIPNGVTVSAADLMPGVVLQEGTPLGIDKATGLYHVIKTAKLVEAASNSATEYKVAKGHHFKEGDNVMLKVGSKAYAITAINRSNATHDVITVGTTLGAAAAVGAALVESGATGATAGAFKYKPKAYTGDSYDVEALNNHLVSAVTIGQYKEALVPVISDDIKAAIPGVVFI